MGAQTSHFTSDTISETSLSSARSGLTYQSCSETSYADSLSTSISEREIVSTPNLEGFSFNDPTNAIRSFRFDSLVGQEGFGSSARSSLIAPSSSETSYAGSFSTSIFEDEILSAPKPKGFQLIELKNATRDFHLEGLLGKGDFGRVFKGWIDEQTLAATKPGSGMVVAIKKYTPSSLEGPMVWLTQFNYRGQLHHPNLVKLIGYCLDGEILLLVYEFMPKGSLEDHLYGRRFQPLSWEMRIKVAIGAARGLFFLHKAKAIHGHFKASNILLDAGFGVKLSDFVRPEVWYDYDCLYNYDHESDIITSDLTYGSLKVGAHHCKVFPGDCVHWRYYRHSISVYVAPEIAFTGMLRAESDVYSFGVVLLELLFGRRAFDNSIPMGEQNLVVWAKPYLGDKRRLFWIMDYKLEGQYHKKGAYIAATVALQCLSTEAKDRPQMAEVLNTLEGIQALKVVANHSNHNSGTVSNPV